MRTTAQPLQEKHSLPRRHPETAGLEPGRADARWLQPHPALETESQPGASAALWG